MNTRKISLLTAFIALLLLTLLLTIRWVAAKQKPDSISTAPPLSTVGGHWAMAYGGSNSDYAYTVQETSDGGFIVAGLTQSFGLGYSDIWFLKLTGDGTIAWQKVIGGSGSELTYSIQEASDGGYIVAGHLEFLGVGNTDVWLLKLDPDGEIVWQKAYGGSGWEWPYSLARTSDGGYVVAGRTDSFVGPDRADAWIVKLDSQGTILWQKTYGGSNDEQAQSIQQTSDGGYIFAGQSYTTAVGYDYWLVKLNDDGSIAWQRTYGGSNMDWAKSVRQTNDGGYVVAGYSYSFGSILQAWILKLDNNGDIEWQKTYGGVSASAYAIQQTADEGFIVAGQIHSDGGGDSGVWVFKLDTVGEVVWQSTYGNGRAESIQLTSDGGYIVAGYTGDFGAGNSDFWLLKLDSGGEITDCSTVGESNASASDTAVTEVDTTVSEQWSWATVIDTSLVPQNPSASSVLVCSEPVMQPGPPRIAPPTLFPGTPTATATAIATPTATPSPIPTLTPTPVPTDTPTPTPTTSWCENHSEPTTCAEEDNINAPIFSPKVSRFQVVATHPTYDIGLDNCDPDFGGCGDGGRRRTVPTDTCFDDPANKLFDDFINAIWVCSEAEWWRPYTMTVTIDDSSLAGHRLVWYRKIDGEFSWPQFLVLYQDGNIRLKPQPPIGRSDTCFGSSVIIGPAPVSERPYVDVQQIVVNPAAMSLDLTYISGETAHVTLSVDRTQATATVEIGYTISETVPFTTFRSMWVADGNADVDHIQTLAGDFPILNGWTSLLGPWWLFHRVYWSSHNTSAPDIRIAVLD